MADTTRRFTVDPNRRNLRQALDSLMPAQLGKLVGMFKTNPTLTAEVARVNASIAAYVDQYPLRDPQVAPKVNDATFGPILQDPGFVGSVRGVFRDMAFMAAFHMPGRETTEVSALFYPAEEAALRAVISAIRKYRSDWLPQRDREVKLWDVFLDVLKSAYAGHDAEWQATIALFPAQAAPVAITSFEELLKPGPRTGSFLRHMVERAKPAMSVVQPVAPVVVDPANIFGSSAAVPDIFGTLVTPVVVAPVASAPAVASVPDLFAYVSSTGSPVVGELSFEEQMAAALGATQPVVVAPAPKDPMVWGPQVYRLIQEQHGSSSPAIGMAAKYMADQLERGSVPTLEAASEKVARFGITAEMIADAERKLEPAGG